MYAIESYAGQNANPAEIDLLSCPGLQLTELVGSNGRVYTVDAVYLEPIYTENEPTTYTSIDIGKIEYAYETASPAIDSLVGYLVAVTQTTTFYSVDEQSYPNLVFEKTTVLAYVGESEFEDYSAAFVFGAECRARQIGKAIAKLAQKNGITSGNMADFFEATSESIAVFKAGNKLPLISAVTALNRGYFDETTRSAILDVLNA